jgi:hypothetical protein
MERRWLFRGAGGAADFLQALVGKRLQADLTVEAAMAISGAAFASAMSSQTRFYEVFLAVANARYAV